jgi:hypothetical protein
VLLGSQCSGSFTAFVPVFVMFLYCILYFHVFSKVTSFVYPLTLYIDIVWLWQTQFRGDDDDNIVMQDFIIDCGNCNM